MISRTFSLIESIPFDDFKNRHNVYFVEMVIRAYCSVGDIEKSLKFFKLKRYPLYSLETLIRACYRYKCIDSIKPFVNEGIELFINEMKAKHDKLDDNVNEKILFQLLNGIGLEDWDVYSFLKTNNIMFTPSLIERLVYIGSLQRNFDFSLKAFNTGIILGFKPSPFIFNDLLTSASSSPDKEDSINILVVYFMMRDHHIRHKTPISNYFIKCFSYSLKIHPLSHGIEYNKIDQYIHGKNKNISDIEWLNISYQWINTFCYKNQIYIRLNHTSNNFIEHNRRKRRYEYQHNDYDTEEGRV